MAQHFVGDSGRIAFSSARRRELGVTVLQALATL